MLMLEALGFISGEIKRVFLWRVWYGRVSTVFSIFLNLLPARCLEGMWYKYETIQIN